MNFAAGGIATPADAAIMMQLGSDGVFVGSGIFKSDNPQKRAKAIVEAVANYNTPEINIKVTDADVILKKVEAGFPDGKHLDIDGVYVDFSDWWFSLRKSNTEPLVRLRIEAESKEKLDEMQEKLVSMIKAD